MASNAVRLARLRKGGSLLMVPMDHGISNGPIQGLQAPKKVLDKVALFASCVTVHKGLLPQVVPYADRLGVLLHLSASTDHAPDPNDKRIVATVHEAVKAGCDGVSIHVNMGSLTEAQQIQDAGAVATACADYGMPLVAMVYPRGPKITDPTDPVLVAHAARLGAELGADVVKVPFTGSADTFEPVVKGCPVPVIIAGGAARDWKSFLADVKAAKKAGAEGVSVGRNVFQHPKPADAMAALAGVFAQ